jgi:hypothetical protein
VLVQHVGSLAGDGDRADVNETFLQPFLADTTQASGGVRYWADSPDSGAEGFGLRITATLLFPR